MFVVVFLDVVVWCVLGFGEVVDEVLYEGEFGWCFDDGEF